MEILFIVHPSALTDAFSEGGTIPLATRLCKKECGLRRVDLPYPQGYSADQSVRRET